MTLTVLIKPEGRSRRLSAWVLQDKRRGANLLEGQITDVESAKRIIQQQLDSKCGPGLKIRWKEDDL